MEYSKLSVHQKINSKHNKTVLNPGSGLSLKRMLTRDGGLFCSGSLILKQEGNRNYDGPGDNYYTI